MPLILYEPLASFRVVGTDDLHLTVPAVSHDAVRDALDVAVVAVEEWRGE